MKRDLPSLNAVRMFEAAARMQSFTRAAAELNVTQGAVSRQIALLEEQLGCKLFNRNGPKLKLTEAGYQYQSVVDDAMEIIRKGTAQLTRGNHSNNITVSVLPSFASYWLLPRLSTMEKALPEISLRLIASHRMIDFTREQHIDFAIRFGKGNWSNLYCKKITEHELFPVCAPALAVKIRCVEDLLNHRLISEPLPYDEWNNWFKKNKVKFHQREDRMIDDTGIQIQAAIDGLGIALVRSEFVKEALQSGRLMRLFDSSIVSEFQFYFVCPPTRLAESNIKAIHDWLLAAE